MSNANPLIPQGSLLEQKAKSRPHLRVAIFIVAIHLVFLGGLLMQGCKREGPITENLQTNDTTLPPLDTNTLYGSNLPPGTNLFASVPEFTNFAPAPAPVYTPPQPTPPAQTVPAAPAQEYVVARGDSFYSIGKKHGVSASAIAKANPGVDSTRLRVGQKLQIPAAATALSSPLDAAPAPGSASDTYVVKPGDTLTRIARSQGTTLAALRELNGLKTDRINVGQKLRVPAKAAAAESPAPLAPASTNVGFPLPPASGAPLTQ